MEITAAVAGRGRGLKTLVPLREGQLICFGTGLKFTSKSKLMQFLKIPGHAVYNDKILLVEDVLKLGHIFHETGSPFGNLRVAHL